VVNRIISNIFWYSRIGLPVWLVYLYIRFWFGSADTCSFDLKAAA